MDVNADKFRDQALFLDNTFPRRSHSIESRIKPTILKIRITLRIATFLVIKAITSLDEGNVNLTFALQRFACSFTSNFAQTGFRTALLLEYFSVFNSWLWRPCRHLPSSVTLTGRANYFRLLSSYPIFRTIGLKPIETILAYRQKPCRWKPFWSYLVKSILIMFSTIKTIW